MRDVVRNAAMGLCLGGAALSLAACGSKEEQSAPKSMDEVKQEAAKLDQPEPGQYKQTIEITRLEVPGMPEDAAEQMKAMMTAAQENTFCLTREDTEKGFKDMFDGIGKGSQCSYSRFDVDGGTLDAQMDCKSPQEGTATMKINGTVKPDGSDVTVAMDAEGGQQPMGNMKMTMHMTTQRVGDCAS
ncbi:hypothetical protein GCM10011494_10270 [Novosphingobium endophyticum]|uniref:DUF3617 domain-containing protein n=1 Tax=Novosphingobium endophyticum TaxID=1955250 RepID=A0A916TQM5_9SPHN|nr:DUF3617 domain-containing protein [Novosphingobium endophyticum]GGB93775.1 hypothetical protein GCM10011494_10270 [Novosphingobium endophyticum]